MFKDRVRKSGEFENMIKSLPGLKSPLMLNLPALERLMVRTYQIKNMFAFLPKEEPQLLSLFPDFRNGTP